jgi:hypothetical protein
MNKFNQIMGALKLGASFSWNYNGIQEAQPTDLRAVTTIDNEAEIGFNLQLFAARHLYNEDLRITFIQENGEIKIYF